MLAAALIILLWLGIVAGALAWMRRAPDPRAGWERLAACLVAIVALTVILAVSSMPGPGLRAAVAEAIEQRSGRLSGRIDCAAAERARTMLNAMSEGRMEMRTDARLLLPAGLWAELGEARRASLVTLAARAGQCARGGSAPDSVQVIDMDSGEIIAAARL